MNNINTSTDHALGTRGIIRCAGDVRHKAFNSSQPPDRKPQNYIDKKSRWIDNCLLVYCQQDIGVCLTIILLQSLIILNQATNHCSFEHLYYKIHKTVIFITVIYTNIIQTVDILVFHIVRPSNISRFYIYNIIYYYWYLPTYNHNWVMIIIIMYLIYCVQNSNSNIY